jgi:hypothetical protein
MGIDVQIPVGLSKLARITGYNLATGKMSISLTNVNQATTQSQDLTIEIPPSFYSVNGMFIGGLPSINTPIVVNKGDGGKFYFQSFVPLNKATLPKNLAPDEILISSTIKSQISLNLKSDIYIGSDSEYLHVNAANGISSNTVSNQMSFTEASRSVNGIIKRERKLSNFPQSLKLESSDFEKVIYPIGLDPSSTVSPPFGSVVKNPPFVENRTLTYEFANSYNVLDDLTESTNYSKIKPDVPKYNLPNRRLTRTDAFSLSLVYPNHLMESIKGTAVDIFGNLLDINRQKIPVGIKNLTLKPQNNNSSASDNYKNIKQEERRGIAYHFELNARKDLNNQAPDVNSSEDHARARSRFFFDLDKEGQFKLNVPASSNTGNIPLNTRYENYSTFDSGDNGNPNKFTYNDDGLDIYHDAFGVGVIDIKSDDGYFTPLDRLTKSHIKHGTVYHDITKTCSTFITNSPTSSFLNYEYNSFSNLSSIPTIDNVVSPKIYVAGPSANAGGRSASVNLDGSLELNIGSNNADSQSLWIDTEGGIVANIGRDDNDISAAISTDGDFLLQIGGSNSADPTSEFRGGAFDIRVVNKGLSVSLIRIDANGITVSTPGTLSIKGRDVNIAAEGSITLDADNVYIYDRPVDKLKITSI